MAYTHLKPGEELELSERVYYFQKGDNVPTLVTFPMDELIRLEQESVEQERAIYGRLLDLAKEWGKRASQTVALRQAQGYLRTLPSPHTSNQWKETEHGCHALSNMVYSFTWRVYERTTWDSKAGKSVPVAWELSWYLTFNTPQDPDCTESGRQIAGQQGKVFKDTADMDKYLQGRIKAYAHLFTELSPPIPKEHEKRFHINGVLLPGYTVENPDALKPDETKVDELLAFLDDEDIGDVPLSPPPEPEPETPSPQAIWEKHRKQRTGASQRKQSPAR